MSAEETAGVQELIDRLSKEGVAAGQQRAEQIVREAERRADGILDAARQQANEILSQARAEADQYSKSGREALRLASRDAVREFGAAVHGGLRNRLQELVRHEMQSPKLIRRMILDITRQATEGITDGPAEILFPEELITEHEATEQLKAGDADALTEFVQGLIGQTLREGFTVTLGTRRRGGLTVRVVDQNVEIDLTAEAIADLLAEHLLPRFRAIMRQV